MLEELIDKGFKRDAKIIKEREQGKSNKERLSFSIDTGDMITHEVLFVPFLSHKGARQKTLREICEFKEEKENKLKLEYKVVERTLSIVLKRLGYEKKLELQDYLDNSDLLRNLFIIIRFNSLEYFRTILEVSKELLLRAYLVSPHNPIDFIAKEYNALDRMLFNYLAYTNKFAKDKKDKKNGRS